MNGEAFYNGRPTSYWRQRLIERGIDKLQFTWMILVDPKPFSAPEALRPMWGDAYGSKDVEDLPELIRASMDLDPTCVPVLTELAQDENWEISSVAVDFLERIDPEAAAKLKTAIQDRPGK